MNTTLNNTPNGNSDGKVQPKVNAEASATQTNNGAGKETFDDSLNSEYIDKRTVVISLVHNYSNYRRANMKVLGQRKETIGSSIRSTQVLSSNADEVNAYFPALIGLSPNNPDFITRVKAWLSNIQFTISENDVTLNTSFIYNKKSDFLKFHSEEEKINDAYDKVDRANTKDIREALKRKIDALNTLESQKHKYGRPENLQEYLMYRHCLLYNEVAKDTALINSDPTIRFYIKDSAKEAEKQKKLTEQRVKAMRNFVEVNGNEKKFNAIYVAACVMRGDNINEALLKERSEKTTILMEFVNTNPDKFNKFVDDKNIQVKAFVETLISRGELVRSEFNQQISTADGQFIGSNMNEAIAWFENPTNADVRTAYENKLKLF